MSQQAFSRHPLWLGSEMEYRRVPRHGAWCVIVLGMSESHAQNNAGRWLLGAPWAAGGQWVRERQRGGGELWGRPFQMGRQHCWGRAEWVRGIRKTKGKMAKIRMLTSCPCRYLRRQMYRSPQHKHMLHTFLKVSVSPRWGSVAFLKSPRAPGSGFCTPYLCSNSF